uniref:Cytochrome P450 n=1 Tax=Panagrolaimus davidi TaxID=227884 RepID=A0A914QHS1_9BILA
MDVQLQKWKKEYGDIHTIWFGDRAIVTLHDIPTILETFVKDGETYAGRPHQKWDDIIREGNNGVVFSEGPKWRENRRFALHVFRNFGLGRNIMQERVLVEVNSLITDIKDEILNGKQEISIHDTIDISVGSIINNLTFGYRYGKDKKDEFQHVKQFSTTLVSQFSNPMYRLMDRDPEYYKKFPICNSYYKYFTAEVQKIKDFFYNLINEHRKAINLESDEDPTDFVEAYLRQQHKLKMEGGVKENENNFDDAQLYATVLDLWVAGQETTSNTLAWVCAYLIQYPEVQQNLHKELDEVIGNDRIITLDDKSNLNYVNAVIAETQRYCNLATANLFHRVTKDTKIHGYNIPVDTIITHQVSTVLMNEKYFPEPEKFRPERFLDENGKFFQPPELIPFGVGKRACLGEGLARLELYLFTANIANQFKLNYPTEKKDFAKRLLKGSAVPSPYLCKIQNRF